MKKILLVAALVVASMSVSAQYFVGGMVGFGSNTEKQGDVKETLTGFNINPEFGYSFHERWDVGISGGYAWSKAKREVPGATADNKGGEWNVTPFIQWAAIQFNDFEIQLRANVGFGGGDVIDPATALFSDNTYTNIGVNIMPIIAYNISDRFQIRASLNCAALGFNYNKTEDGSNPDIKSTSFGLMGDTGNLLNTNDFQLGFVVNF